MGRKRKAEPECPIEDSLSTDDGEDLCSDGSPGSRKEKPVAQRNTANARERQRMRVLSKAFTRLKTALPWVPPDTKLSKLDTLKLASCYIGHLRQILQEDDAELSSTNNNDGKLGGGMIHPMTLTWPFSFNGRPTGIENRRTDTLKLPNKSLIHSSS